MGLGGGGEQSPFLRIEEEKKIYNCLVDTG